MKKPGLQDRSSLSAAISLLAAGIFALLIYNYFQGIVFAAGGNPTALIQVAEISKVFKIEPVFDLSRMPQSWRKKLSKRIFADIHHELQWLEQQKILRNSAEGKLLIKKVRASLQNMKAGKRRFILNGVESSLNPFYGSRTWLEYRLWKLKNLTIDLEMDQAKTQSVYRVYALLNKWLVYVAHREIIARRKGIVASPQIADAAITAEQDTEKANQTFPQISEVARITEQDIEKANIALSKQPDPAKTAEPFFETESDFSSQTSVVVETAEPVFENENSVFTQTSDVGETMEPVVEAENKVATQTSDTAEAAEPVIETENQASPQMPDMDETSESVAETFESNIENETLESSPVETGVIPESESNSILIPDVILDGESGSSQESLLQNWMIVLGAVGIIIISFLIFRRAGKQTTPQASGRMEVDPCEDSSEPYTAHPASARDHEEETPKIGDTAWGNLVAPMGDAPDHSAIEQIENVEEPASVTELPEYIASPGEDSVWDREAPEDMASPIEDSTVEESALDKELEDLSSNSEMEESDWEDEAEDEVQESFGSEDEESSPDNEPEDEVVEESATDHETIYYTAFKMEESVTDDDVSERSASQEESSSDYQADEDAEEHLASPVEDSTVEESALDSELEESSSDNEREESDWEDEAEDEVSGGMASQAEESATGINEKALVVDGVKENRVALSELLSSIGVEASGADNVHSGTKHTESHHPEIIFWDVDVLNKKGRKALRAFQEKNGKDRYKMVVITDSDFDPQRIANWNLKFHARLSKPIQKVDVLNCLQELLDREFDSDAEELREENEAWDTEASPTAESQTEDEIPDYMASQPEDSSEDSEMKEPIAEESVLDHEAPEHADSQVTDDEADDEAQADMTYQAEEPATDSEDTEDMASSIEESPTDPEASEYVASKVEDSPPETEMTDSQVTDDEAVDEAQESAASQLEESAAEESFTGNKAEDETSEQIASQDEESVADDEIPETIASPVEEPVSDDDTTESITFSVVETSTNRETEKSPATDKAMDSYTDDETAGDMVSQTKEWPANNEMTEYGAEEPVAGPTVKALVVDKVKKNRRAFSKLLSGLGVETSQAENVKEGMKHTRAHHPDIIFVATDVLDKNGRRSLRSLQQKEGEDRYKMVALTDSDFDPQCADKWKLKFHAHLSQPFQKEDILICLRELLEFDGEEPSVDREAKAVTEVDASENQDVSQAPLVELDGGEPSVDREAKAVMEDEAKENREVSQTPVPEDQETDHPDVLLLQTILKVAKGFQDINKRLHKIAETRYGPAVKSSSKDSKGKEEN